MSLIVEDGTGRADAESFVSVTDADAYHSKRGNAAWTGADAVKEAALRKATDFMEGVYRERWGGSRTGASQSLSWPRDFVEIRDVPSPFSEATAYVASDVVPPQVANACAELALRALSGDLNADLSQGVKSKAVGTLRIDYDTNTPQSKRYPAVDAMLRPLLKGSGGISLVRG